MTRPFALMVALACTLGLAACVDVERTPFSPQVKENERRAATLEMVQHIVDFEARRDADGRIVVYDLPPQDGGGAYEVAGINERYHPAAAARLREMIASGQSEAAERQAVLYIADKTHHPADRARTDAIRFLLRDIAWNRGPTGAVKTLQIALGVASDGIFGPITSGALTRAEADPAALVSALTAARETYERRLGRNETSIFWAGLQNRWTKAAEQARTYL